MCPGFLRASLSHILGVGFWGFACRFGGQCIGYLQGYDQGGAVVMRAVGSVMCEWEYCKLSNYLGIAHLRVPPIGWVFCAWKSVV